MDVLLTTREVLDILKVDRITIYRMLQDAGLKASKLDNSGDLREEKWSALQVVIITRLNQSSQKPIPAFLPTAYRPFRIYFPENSIQHRINLRVDHPIVDIPAVSPVQDQFHFAQHRQLLGDISLPQAQIGFQVADAVFPVAQDSQNSQPGRVR